MAEMASMALSSGGRKSRIVQSDKVLAYEQLVRVPLGLRIRTTELSSSVICLALLNLRGSEAFNSIIGLMTDAIGMTYTISICGIIW